MKLLRTALLAVALLATAGCAGNNTPAHTAAAPSSSETTNGFSFRWTAGPGIDLLSPDSTFVRASVESVIAFKVVGSPGLYPGFADAANGRYSMAYGPSRSLPASVGYPLGLESIHEGPAGVIAAVCDFSTSVSRGGSAYVNMVTYRRGKSAPPARQTGNAKRPELDVSGGWQLLSFGPYPQRAQSEAAAAECTKIRPTDTSNATPYPGWPGRG